LRQKILKLGHTFNYKGQSDTETLLCCFEVFGIKKTIQEAIGMFAFAVYDNFLSYHLFQKLEGFLPGENPYLIQSSSILLIVFI